MPAPIYAGANTNQGYGSQYSNVGAQTIQQNALQTSVQSPQPAGLPMQYTTQQPYPVGSLQVVQVSDRAAAENYPVAAGATVIFMNYNARRLWIKTEHTNGLSYDIDEQILFSAAEIQRFEQQVLQNTQTQQQNASQQAMNFVPREEFEELKRQFEEFIK